MLPYHQIINQFIPLLEKIGEYALTSFRKKDLTVSNKGADNRLDPFTHIDTYIETELCHFIHQLYPEHNVYGEEFGASQYNQNQTEFTWFIDPIDGTGAFISGMLHWGILIGLQHKKRNDIRNYVSTIHKRNFLRLQ